MGEADFNQFMQLRNHLVIAAKNFGREENLSPRLITTMSKGIDGQLKVAQKVVDAVDQAHRKTSLTMLRYNLKKPEKFFA